MTVSAITNINKNTIEVSDMNECALEDTEIGWEDCYDLLEASGAFFDLGCDEFERDDITEQFYNLCNR